MKKFKIFFLAAFFVCSFDLLAQEDKEEMNVNKKDQLLKELKALERKPNLDFAATLRVMQDKLLEYAVWRKQVCLGEVSSEKESAGSETGSSNLASNTLSKEEKKLCLLELIKTRKAFANSIFNLRENYLRQQWRKQLENLEKLRAEALRELDEMAKKLE